MIPKKTPKPTLSTWIVNTKADSLNSQVMRDQTAVMISDIRGLFKVSGLGKGKKITNVTFENIYPEIGMVILKCPESFIKLVQKLPSVGHVEPKHTPKKPKNSPKKSPKGPKNVNKTE